MNSLQSEKFKHLFENILEEKSFKPNKAQNEEGKPSGDDVDLFNFNQEKELSSKLVNRNSLYLKKVQYALEKIKNNTFGICEDCDGKISDQRLKARPTATLCINCKEENERIENSLFDKSNIIKLPQRNLAATNEVNNDPFKQNVKKLDNGDIRILV